MKGKRFWQGAPCLHPVLINVGAWTEKKRR
jgi:hypothetical protein